MISSSIRNALRAPIVSRAVVRPATLAARPMMMMKFQRNYSSDHHEETFEEFTAR